jgi:hypothetical protein
LNENRDKNFTAWEFKSVMKNADKRQLSHIPQKFLTGLDKDLKRVLRRNGGKMDEATFYSEFGNSLMKLNAETGACQLEFNMANELTRAFTRK